jgi:protein-disulfide isomerase/uncharacterized membrane protein
MKRNIYIILVLAFVGFVLSGILIFQHYNPDEPFLRLLCGKGGMGDCVTLSKSRFSTLFGIPIAAFGILYYLMVLFVILIADYARGKYYPMALVICTPLTAIAILADLVLAIILIAIKVACSLCIATYGINVLIMIFLILAVRSYLADTGESISDSIKKAFSLRDASTDRKAFFAAFIPFMVLLMFTVMLASVVPKLKGGERPARGKKIVITQKHIDKFLNDFYKAGRVQIDLERESRMRKGIVMGNTDAPFTIYAFSDFLCSACNAFYKVEEQLLKKYGDTIRIVYFNYPLDGSCNRDVDNTVYPQSCTASRAVIAAYLDGFHENYIAKHFEQYKRLKKDYSREKAANTLDRMDPGARGDVSRSYFGQRMRSGEVSAILNSHMELARSLKIDATPTLFIMNRRIDGFPPIELLDSLLEKELSK